MEDLRQLVFTLYRNGIYELDPCTASKSIEIIDQYGHGGAVPQQGAVPQPGAYYWFTPNKGTGLFHPSKGTGLFHPSKGTGLFHAQTTEVVTTRERDYSMHKRLKLLLQGNGIIPSQQGNGIIPSVASVR